jgi:thymidylate synthase (FAD)
MNVQLIALTSPSEDLQEDHGIWTAEDLIVYAARVSNPANQMNKETAPRLINYCIKNGHWSIFETASMTVEIETSRAISAQLLRHRSFTFQEFSQRYAVSMGREHFDLRKQDTKNRQGSGEPIEDNHLYGLVTDALMKAQETYHNLIAAGVSKETARMVLPLCTTTRLYMTGNVRSWIHYLEQRTSEGTQTEHREIALAIKAIFTEKFPNISRALYESHT